jgi:hypothetical protein
MLRRFAMALQLVFNDEWAISIPLSEYQQEAWDLQQARAARGDDIDGLSERLAYCFASSLIACLDSDLKPPPEADIQLGMAIARDLGLSLHADALRYNGSMTAFIRRFGDVHQRRLARNTNAPK